MRKEGVMDRKTVGIVIFDEIEVLDFCGPFEVFSVTLLHEEKRREEPSPFEVVLIAKHGGTITTTGGIRVAVDYSFSDCPTSHWHKRLALLFPLTFSLLRP